MLKIESWLTTYYTLGGRKYKERLVFILMYERFLFRPKRYTVTHIISMYDTSKTVQYGPANTTNTYSGHA